jgi:glycine oxidase
VKLKIDNIVVGAGLAGTWLSYQFIKSSKSFVLIDETGHSKSSFVAAGIYNPILANRQKISYNADEIYPNLGKKYHEIEHLIHEKIFHKHPVSYIIDSLRELNDWAALAESHLFKDFVIMTNERMGDQIISDFGALEIQDSGWVDIPLFLKSFRKKIQNPNVFLEEKFYSNALECFQNSFIYKNYEAKNIIFCQGTAIQDNPLTANIKLKPAKGEILIIKSDELVEEIIPQSGVFLLPLGNNLYKVGSNFEWKTLDFEPSDSAKNEIISKLTKWFKAPFEIVDHQAGIRPSSLDRRPILGRLDCHPSAYVFNGLGSKGVALAPLYSEILCKYIYDGVELPPEVDVARFK